MFSVCLNMATVSGNMEDRCSDRSLSAENLYVLQKLEEILHRKEMEITSLESEIYSSQRKLPVVRCIKSTASGSIKQQETNGLGLENELSKGVTHTDNKIKEEETKMLRVIMRGKQLVKISPGSSSRGCKLCINFHKGEQCLQTSEVKQVIERLRILEKETESMRQEFFECLEDSKALVNEIYQQLETIHYCLQHENQVNGEKPFAGSLITNTDKKPGLIWTWDRMKSRVGGLLDPINGQGGSTNM